MAGRDGCQRIAGHRLEDRLHQGLALCHGSGQQPAQPQHQRARPHAVVAEGAHSCRQSAADRNTIEFCHHADNAAELPATLSPNASQQHVQPTLHLLSLVRLNQRLVSLRLHAPYSLYGKQDMTDVMIFCEETGGKNRLPLLEIPSESCTIQIICVSLQ